MSNFIIYHNPRCSKSRQTLEILKNKKLEPKIIYYLEDPPSKKKIGDLLKKLNISARQLLRKSEKDYKDNNLSDLTKTDAEIIDIMNKYPKLIERPIVISGDKAVLGRPPENVNKLFRE